MRLHDVGTNIREIAQQCGLDAGVSERAIAFIESGAPCLGVSGWLASGKDTVAEAVFEHLGVHAVQQSFGAALKRELDDILTLVRYANTHEELAAGVREYLSCTAGQTEQMIATLVSGELADAQLQLVNVTARSRTPEVRAALQLLGTDIRRSQNTDYWVLQGLKGAIEQMADGNSVYFTDCRFINEAAGLQKVGIPVVRLDVSRTVQAQRLWDRDGLELDPIATAHPSETALDGWPDFDVVVDNDGSVENAVDVICEAFSWTVTVAAN